jgi:hypothetical protein
MFHTVTEFSPKGEELKTYLCINDAIKDRNISRSTILAHINGKRKVCLWRSEIYNNDIVLPNGDILTSSPIEGVLNKLRAIQREEEKYI